MNELNKRDLALLLLQWEDEYEALAHTEDRIKRQVKLLGETVVAGYVQAKYNPGRKTYNYKVAAEPRFYNDDEEVVNAAIEVREAHTTQRISESVAWKKVCEDLGIKDIPCNQSDPSVKVTLTE